jgi:hypothetical protein
MSPRTLIRNNARRAREVFLIATDALLLITALTSFQVALKRRILLK